MIYWRLLVSGLIVLGALYYIMVVLHCFGLISLTKKNVKFIKAVIPFYYWLSKQKVMNEEAIKKLEDLIKFGWNIVDSEAAELYEEKINEIIKILKN